MIQHGRVGKVKKLYCLAKSQSEKNNTCEEAGEKKGTYDTVRSGGVLSAQNDQYVFLSSLLELDSINNVQGLRQGKFSHALLSYLKLSWLSLQKVS